MNLPRRFLLPVVAATLLAGVAAGAPPPGPAAPAAAAPAAAPAPTLTLDEALSLAARQNLALRQAGLQVPRARAAQERAAAAARASGAALSAALQQRYGLALPADEETAAASLRSADLAVRQVGLSLTAAGQATRLAVTRAYVEWQKAGALAAAQRVALARARAQLAGAQAAVTAGSAAKYDVLQASAQVAAQQAALTGAEAGREAARLGLQRLVGSPVAADTQPQSTLPGPDAGADLPDAEALIARAIRERADVASARTGVTAKEQDLALLSRYLGPSDPAIAIARLGLAESALQLEAVQADVELQVQQALLGAASARERLIALIDGEAQAREALRLAELRFEAGAATSVELVSSQAALAAAEAGRIQASADLAAALATLAHATGEL